MKIPFVIGLIALLCATGALAHSDVRVTVPPDGAVVAEVPEVVTFTFASPIRLTAVELAHPDHPAVELDPGAPSFSTEIAVPVVDMGEGVYRIEWRGLGIDGHAVRGELTFEVE